MNSDRDSTITVEVDDRLDDLFGDGGDQGSNLTKKGSEADNRKGDGAKESHSESANMGGSENSLIDDLKAVVLSLEWEISDQVMHKLSEEIENLKDACRDDKIVVAFLQLLDSLGKYIQKKKAEAHPDSISLLNSVYENLETVILSGDLGDAEKKRMLVTQVGRYKELKEDIKKPREKPVRKPPIEHDEKRVVTESPEPSVVSLSDHDAESDASPLSGVSNQNIVQALRDINKTIQTEFKALRQELKLWRESR